MASNIKVDIVRPTATNGSLNLKGDSGGSATANGITVNSSGNTSITGTTTISSADINGGTIDGATIGGTTPAAGTFTTFTSTGIDDNAASTTLTIDSSGNVGIGTTNPSATLHIKSSSGNIRLEDADDVNSSFSIIRSDAGGSLHFEADEGDSTANSTLRFSIDNTERMRIDSSGNLKFDSGYGSAATAYGCRAWVNFRGTSQSGTATASGLVSGQYTATVNSATQFTVEYSGTPYTINTSGNHEIGDGEGVDLTVSGTTVTIDTQIRASGNVSSTTDNGTGRYTVNFTTAMSDVNYSVCVSGRGSDGNRYTGIDNVMTTSSIKVYGHYHGDGSYQDMQIMCISIFR